MILKLKDLLSSPCSSQIFSSVLGHEEGHFIFQCDVELLEAVRIPVDSFQCVVAVVQWWILNSNLTRRDPHLVFAWTISKPRTQLLVSLHYETWEAADHGGRPTASQILGLKHSLDGLPASSEFMPVNQTLGCFLMEWKRGIRELRGMLRIWVRWDPLWTFVWISSLGPTCIMSCWDVISKEVGNKVSSLPKVIYEVNKVFCFLSTCSSLEFPLIFPNVSINFPFIPFRVLYFHVYTFIFRFIHLFCFLCAHLNRNIPLIQKQRELFSYQTFNLKKIQASSQLGQGYPTEPEKVKAFVNKVFQLLGVSLCSLSLPHLSFPWMFINCQTCPFVSFGQSPNWVEDCFFFQLKVK